MSTLIGWLWWMLVRYGDEMFICFLSSTISLLSPLLLHLLKTYLSSLAFHLSNVSFFFSSFSFKNLGMDYNPSNFVDLLNSQQDVPFGLGEDSVHVSSSQVPHLGETPAERKERRTWTPTDDQVLISAWLNTSKDPIVGNEQRSGAFWQRIAAYFAASPKIGASERRESSHCKQHWHKINDQVGKFCGAFEAASRERTSGQTIMTFWSTPMRSSSTTTTRNSLSNMRGRSFETIKNGVTCQVLKWRVPVKGGSSTTF